MPLEAFALTVVVPLTVAPFTGEVIETVDTLLLTITVTSELVAKTPDVSFATAESRWLPFATEVEFHEKVYGDEVTSEPTSVPSTCSCTLAIPMPLVAVAVTLTEPVTVASFAGELMVTTGGEDPAARNATICITYHPLGLTVAVAL